MDSLVLSNIAHRPARTAVSILGTGVGVLLIVFTVGLAHGVLHERGRRESNIGAEIMIRASGTIGLSGGSQFRLPTSHAAELAQIRGVRAATPLGQTFDKSDSGFGQRLIDGIEYDAGIWRIPAHRSDMLRGDIVARQHDDVEFVSALHQELGNRADVRMEQHFDAALLHRAHVGLLVLEVVGDERHLATQRRRDLEQLLHAQRAGILVRPQQARIDHQQSLARLTIALELGANAVGLMRCEHGAPLVREGCLVDRLMPLDSFADIDPRGLPLEMNDRRGRLVEDFAP